MHRKWWTLLAVCVAVFMLLLDITVVNVALPNIQRELDASFSELQWIVDAYALTLAALLLTAGSLADLLGRRTVFVVGLGLFTVASLACGLAPSAVALDFGRGAQGVGGAIMFATSVALIAQEFQGRERGVAFGIWGATIGAGVAIGPLVGGALTEGFGWEWIFFVNVPIGLVGIALSLSRLAESRDPEGAGVDWAGVVTFSLGLFCLVFALIRGNAEGWGSAPIVALLVGSAVLLGLFLVVERRHPRPMFDLTLFRKPTFGGANAVAFALSASMFAMFLYLTLYLQNVLAYEPLQAGLRFLPLTLVSFCVAPLAGAFSARLPARLLMSLGLALVGTGLALMHGVHADSRWTTLLAGFVVAGAGIGMTNPVLASTSVGVVPPQRSGMASGINQTFRQVGIATGIAAWGAIFQHRVQTELASLLAGTPAAAHGDRLAEAVASGGARGAIQAVPPKERATVVDAAGTAFATALNEILLIGAVVAFTGAVVALVLVRQRDLAVHGQPAAAPAHAG